VDQFNVKFGHVHSHSALIEEQFEIHDLYACLKELDQMTSECIILFEISGFSIKEIMGIQNSSEAAVKQRLSRGRKQLLLLMKSLELKTV
jgi:RNA polymerase sigma-70 factor (ECF subfamily)